MSNMHYVMFENTYIDLQECYDEMENEDLSESEEKYRLRIVNLCKVIINNYEYLLETE